MNFDVLPYAEPKSSSEPRGGNSVVKHKIVCIIYGD